MEQSYDIIAACILLAVLAWFLWELHKAPVVCECYENHKEPENRRIKCQYEYKLEEEQKQHAITRSQLVAAVGELVVANAEVNRLHKELEYLQLKYEKLKEKERVTVLPSFSDLCTDPNPARMVFGGEEVVDTPTIDDAINSDLPIYPDRRA